jgi:hypothetical protein
MINESQAIAIAQARAEANGWGWAEPIAVVAREAWFSKRILRYEIETNAGMLGTKARFVVDAETGAISSEGYLPR